MGRIWSQVSSTVKRRLAWSTVGSIALPWLAGEFVKTFHQPGLDNDAVRASQLIDIMVIAVAVFALTMVFTVGFGCVITAVMKGPRFFGDPFPEASTPPRERADD